jgi:hyperosmotically inducible periplasmic protein
MKNKGIGAMTIWILSAGSAGTSLAQQAGSDHAQQQVAQIRMRLQKNPDLRDNAIGVSVHNGVATLTGSVDTETEKSDAARLALVNGIVGVDNRLDVASNGVRQAVSDSGLTAKIKGKLVEDEMIRFSDVAVTTNNGVVTLTGTVADEEALKQALSVARSSGGVARVENDLTIAPTKQR